MAYFEINKSKAIEQYKKLTKKGLVVSFSLKTNNVVAKILEENTNSLFSIHSFENLDLIKDKKRVIYIAQAWNKERIKKLLSKGIENFIVDNEKDLENLLLTLKKTNKKINLFLRMKLKEHTIFTGRYYVFGMHSLIINNLIPKLKSNKNIKKLGIHFHRKTQNISEWNLKYELKHSLSKETLKSIDYINIGGGLPVKYKNTSDDNLSQIFDKINQAKKWLEKFDIKTIIEPGRFIAAPAGRLITKIISMPDDKTIIIDASVYNSNMDTILVPIKLLVEGELNKKSKEGVLYTIKGLTPDSMDIFRYSVKLPKKQVGDKIIFLNAGAYNYSTDFFNLKKLKNVIIG